MKTNHATLSFKVTRGKVYNMSSLMSRQELNKSGGRFPAVAILNGENPNVYTILKIIINAKIFPHLQLSLTLLWSLSKKNRK